MQAAAAITRQDVFVAEGERLPASPFLKWAGGKGKLLPQLQPFLPPMAAYARYFEPFLGGGAVFFHLQPERSLLSDLNEDLINVYTVIRDNLPALIAALGRHRDDPDYYYELRGQQTGTLTPTEQASRLIYLNKWCYNGLYRVNSKGQFNVPRGAYSTPRRIFNEANLQAVSRLLKRATLKTVSYESALEDAGEGDFVYLDPPYQPLSATAHFTAYTKDSFDEGDQRRLAAILREIDQRGAHFLLNNHETEGLRTLYEGFNIDVAIANRTINSRIDRRGGVRELIVTNYHRTELA